MKLRCRGRAQEIGLEGDGARIDGRRVAFRQVRVGGDLYALEIAGTTFHVRAVLGAGGVSVWCEGRVYEFAPAGAGAARTAEHAGDLLSPMPGRVLRTFVKAGDLVRRGEVVMILEAMKMEHAIRAPRDGVVTRVAHDAGDLVDAGVALAEIAGE